MARDLSNLVSCFLVLLNGQEVVDVVLGVIRLNLHTDTHRTCQLHPINKKDASDTMM